jgi:hypothetical protein
LSREKQDEIIIFLAERPGVEKSEQEHAQSAQIVRANASFALRGRRMFFSSVKNPARVRLASV